MSLKTGIVCSNIVTASAIEEARLGESDGMPEGFQEEDLEANPETYPVQSSSDKVVRILSHPAALLVDSRDSGTEQGHFIYLFLVTSGPYIYF